MGKKKLIDRVKNVVYGVVLPIYLWSIGFKTLDEYLKELEKDYWAHV